MSMQQSSQRGVTLLELLLYISIFSMVMLATVAFFGTVTSARVKNQSIAEVNDQGAQAMDLMLQTIRNASSITSPAATASAASLTVVVPTATLSPTIINLNGTELQVKQGAAAAVPITSSDVQITSITFKNLTRSGTPGIVQVSFVMKHYNPDNHNEYDYQKTFTGSAELTW